jgi:hypothetical protein
MVERTAATGLGTTLGFCLYRRGCGGRMVCGAKAMKSVRREIQTGPFGGKVFVAAVQAVLSLLLCACAARAEVLTLTGDERPGWLERDGIVMAGSWEPLLFRVRRDGASGYVPTAEQRAAYVKEHGGEMIGRLKELGVNFVMMHCYKGAGLGAERESMSEAVEFAELCRDSGLRVGVYNYSGAFLWEPLFEERPEAREWVLLDGAGKPRTYGSAAYRYYWNRNHPGAQAFYREIVRFAVEDIRADLLHFDNYVAGPGRDANSVARFGRYLRERFTAAQLAGMGVSDVDKVEAPMTEGADGPLRRAWLDFCCQSLADSYHDMNRYARSLRKDILIECNPGGPGDRIRPPLDHGRLLSGGEAFWDEGRRPGYQDGRLQTRIRTYKVARRAANMAFAYTTNALEAAESMAFNRDCLGCVCWFEYGKMVAEPASKEPVSGSLAPFIEFFHKRRDLLGGARVVADVAVLRSFASQAYGEARYGGMSYQVEEALIEKRGCFEIIYDQDLDELRRYRVLVLAGCVAVSDEQAGLIEEYVRSGGKVCIVGSAGSHDEWLVPRQKGAFDHLRQSNVVRVGESGDVISAIREICEGGLSADIEAGTGLCAELTEQSGRRLLHLVNYRTDSPATGTAVRLRLPVGRRVESVMLASPERAKDVHVSFEVREGAVKFTVPKVGTYEIAIVTMK